MFGSQALETAIGLALMFFVMASLASAVVEGVSRLLRKRARDLEQTIGQMLSGSTKFDEDAKHALDLFKGTAVYQSATVAAGRGRRWFRTDVGPAYLSARSFANALDELADKATETPIEGLNNRLAALKAGGHGLTLEAKATVESWFDETMGRLGGAYKRWATAVIFGVGLVLAVGGNVSAFHAVQTLWQQPAVRQAALAAAEQAATKSTSPEVINENVRTVQDLAGLGLPVGWDHSTHWNDAVWTLSQVTGWVVTALLLMLGAPFWFDVLSRLVSLRATGAKPLTAAQDPAAATSRQTSADSSKARSSETRADAASAVASLATAMELAAAEGASGASTSAPPSSGPSDTSGPDEPHSGPAADDPDPTPK